MRTKQGSVLQSLRAVQVFLDTHAARLGDVVKTGARKNLDDAIVTLTSHATVQSGSFLEGKSSTQQQRALRLALRRDHMRPIARIAAAELPVTPAVEPLRIPKGRLTVEKLAGAAKGMGTTAAKYADTFIAAGLPTDFVDRLNNAVDALLGTLGQRTQSRGKRNGATKGIKVTLAYGRKIVGVLDAMVVSAIWNDQALLAEWNAVKRVQLIAVRQNPDSPAPAGSPGPTVKAVA